ncbi:MAG: manganese catalase family protein [Clostridia bacterium]|nr:manganese catalase family protein [Clostridia bacterium]
MWIYMKKLEYPVEITAPNVRMAKALMAQYGGPDSELAAGTRYLTQRFSMPDDRVRATLNDIGTEELAHWEMIGTMILQCMKNASIAEIEAAGLAGYYVMHNHAVFPADPNGVPFTTAYIQATGDPITDLVEDLAAEQKARTTYEHLMNMTEDPALLGPLRFLREREIVHYQRFGECLDIVQSMIPNNNERIRFVARGDVVTSGDACYEGCDC